MVKRKYYVFLCKEMSFPVKRKICFLERDPALLCAQFQLAFMQI